MNFFHFTRVELKRMMAAPKNVLAPSLSRIRSIDMEAQNFALLHPGRSWIR